MKNIRLVIFDLDGTLLDAYPAIIKSFNYTMKRLGYPARDALTIRRAVGWGDENLLKPFVSPGDLKKALSVYRKHHKTALLEGSKLFPGVIKLLVCLKKKGKLIAAASNRPTKFSLILMRHLGLVKYLDYFLCADKLKHGKPHPQILNKIRQRFVHKPAEVLYAGDMTIDVQAGRRAGIRTVAVTSGSSTKEELEREKPYRLIGRISELSNML